MAAETFDLPDGHRTVELRSLARRPGTRTLTAQEGVLLANSELEFGGVFGRVPDNLLFGFLERHEFQGQLLFVSDGTPEVAGLTFTRARVFGRNASEAPVLRSLPAGLELRTAHARDDFSRFDDEPMEELYDAVRQEPMCVVADGSQILSAAWVPWRSEGFGDLSVDTVKDFRGQGLAMHTSWAMIAALVAEGLTPVWGAMENNEASVRLAERLGFSDEMGPVYLATYPARTTRANNS